MEICLSYPALISFRHFFSSTLPQKPLVAFCMCPSVAICTDLMPRECRLSTAAATVSSVVMSLPLLLASSCTFRTSSFKRLAVSNSSSASNLVFLRSSLLILSVYSPVPVSSSSVDWPWVRMLLRRMERVATHFTQCCRDPTANQMRHKTPWLFQNHCIKHYSFGNSGAEITSTSQFSTICPPSKSPILNLPLKLG